MTLDVLLDVQAHFSAHRLGTGGTLLLRHHASCVRTPDINRRVEGGTPLGALPPQPFLINLFINLFLAALGSLLLLSDFL